MFKGFKPQGLQKIATRMGYAGSMENFDDYLKQNPDKEREMIVYRSNAQEMARGGAVRKMQEGGTPVTPQTQAPTTTLGTGEGQVDAYGDVATTTTDADGNVVQGTRPANVTDVTAKMAQTGAIPVGAVTQPQLTPVMQEQMISDVGQVGTAPVAPTAQATTAQADAPITATATQMEAAQVSPEVQDAIQANQAAQTDLTDPRAKVVAAQQTASSVANVTAAQGNSIQLDNPVQREIQAGELDWCRRCS